jgi:hypothetical protein
VSVLALHTANTQVFWHCILPILKLYSYLLLFFEHNFYLTYMSTAVLPVMLSSKLLPEMEIEEITKRETLLSGITNLPVPTQIEKLKVINAI